MQEETPDHTASTRTGLPIKLRNGGISDAKIKDLPSKKGLRYNLRGEKGGANSFPPPKAKLKSDTNRNLLATFSTSADPRLIDRAYKLLSKDPELSASFPAPATPLWADRTTGRDVSPMDWVRMHYGSVNNDGTWNPDGLTRADLAHDKTLAVAVSQWIKRHPEDDFDPASRRKLVRYSDPNEAVQRIREQKRGYSLSGE